MAVEFIVTLEDRPGTLADLTETLAKNAVNIVAIHATSCPSEGCVQFITSDADATIEALKEAAVEYTAQEVLLVTLKDQPGTLAHLTRTMSNAGININSLYVTTRGQLALDVDNLAQAQQVVMELGLTSDSAEFF